MTNGIFRLFVRGCRHLLTSMTVRSLALSGLPAMQGTVDDHGGAVAVVAHRLDPARSDVTAGSASSRCSAELADGSGLLALRS
jgi:hypothetical protein